MYLSKKLNEDKNIIEKWKLKWYNKHIYFELWNPKPRIENVKIYLGFVLIG
jgi:hypothetical protein